MTEPTPTQNRCGPPGIPALPYFQPFANLTGGADRLADVPSLHRIVTQLVLAEASAVTLAVAGRLSYLRRADQCLESKFPVRLVRGMIRLNLALFCEKWHARIVSEDARHFVVRLREADADTFWQRCLGNKTGVEIHLELKPLEAGQTPTSEVLVTIRPFGGDKQGAVRKLDELGPLLLVSLRDELQNTPDQRGHVRWPCSATLDVYPVQDDRPAISPLAGRCQDVSFRGLAFWVAQRPAAPRAYLHFKTFAELAPLVLLVQVVRAKGVAGGGFMVGAAFATAAGVVTPPAKAGRTGATKNVDHPDLSMDSRLGD